VYEVVAMSPHSIERSDRSSTSWLWVLLAICLVGWRVSTRVEQYRPSIACASHQAQVTFFDANERNGASRDTLQSGSRLVAELADRLFATVELKAPVPPPFRRQWGERTILPPIYVDSISLFSNPPPALT
jgi:hypothetical protein